MTDIESLHSKFTSKVLSGDKREINYNDWTDEQLMDTYKEALQTIKILMIENDLFENYLRRKEPERLNKLSQIVMAARLAQHIAPMRQIHTSGSKTASIVDSNEPASSPSFSSNVDSGSANIGGGAGRQMRRAKGFKLTLAHRMELVKREMAYFQRKYMLKEKRTFKEIERVYIELEEMKERFQEVKECAAVFQRDVLNKVNPDTNRAPFDAFMKFFDYLRNYTFTATDKLNLRMTTTKHLIKETRRQQEQMRSRGGTILRPIDFKKVIIETDRIIEDTEDHHRKLDMNKQLSAFYVVNFKKCQQLLNEKKNKLRSIEDEIVLEKQKKVKICRDQVTMSREVKKVENKLSQFKELYEEYEYPELRDFLDVQRQLQEVRKNYKKLCRQRKLQLFAQAKPLKKIGKSLALCA